MNRVHHVTAKRLGLRFPPDFLWGAATAAYQIEGGVAEGGRGPSIWDTFSHTPGAIRNGENGDVACDHYHLWEGDLDLAAEMGLTAYRLSVSWSRLQPDGTGDLNRDGVDFYRRLLTGINERGMTPFVTLYHWDMPQPLEDFGGWPRRETAAAFAAYARATVSVLGDLATSWLTLNEPWCSSFLGHYAGDHAPGRQDLAEAVAAAHHLNLAHGLAVGEIRDIARNDLEIGIANIITDVHPASDQPEDAAAAGRVDANGNLMFLGPVYRGVYPDQVHDLYDAHGLEALVRDGDLEVISSPTDFVGVNHYHRSLVTADPTDPHLGAAVQHDEPIVTSVGWSFRPESLRNVLVRVRDSFTRLPQYVTESGAAFADVVDDSAQVIDEGRVTYLGGYLNAAAGAVADGVDLRGYFVWSLLDNFEWAEGYEPRFGLVHIDYTTQKRTPKSSAHWYRALIRQHAQITDGAGESAREGKAENRETRI